MAVAFDAVGPSSAGTAATAAATLSWTHTAVGTSGLVAVVGVALGASSATQNGYTLSVTYGGVAMTSLGKVSANAATAGYVQLFGLVGAKTGAQTVAVTASTAPATLVGGSITFTGGGSFGTAVTGSNSNTSPVISVPCSGTGNMVVDALACGSAVSSSSTTLRWNDNASGQTGAGNAAQSTTASVASGSNVAMAYTIATDYWGLVGVEVKAAAGGAAAPRRPVRVARQALARSYTY